MAATSYWVMDIYML